LTDLIEIRMQAYRTLQRSSTVDEWSKTASFSIYLEVYPPIAHSTIWYSESGKRWDDKYTYLETLARLVCLDLIYLADAW